MTRILATALYGLFGGLFLLAGSILVLNGAGLLPDALSERFASLVAGNREIVHILQEYGCLLLVLGLLTLWFVRHYEVSGSFHWAMTAFWALVALIHWFDVRGPVESLVGPLINTTPFVLFLAIGLLRLATDHRPAKLARP
jgi:hypothetical protein